MKKILFILLILLFVNPCFAAKVVREKETGKIVYRSDPPFEDGFGAKNAALLYGGKPEDYTEVSITQEEWDAHINYKTDEQLIRDKMNELLRKQAVEELKKEGKLK